MSGKEEWGERKEEGGSELFLLHLANTLLNT